MEGIRTGGGVPASVSGGAEARRLAEVRRERPEGTVSFSEHALGRIGLRRIGMVGNRIDRFKGVMRRLEPKGVRESLVLLRGGDCADPVFVVNVRGRTVVTAITGAMMREGVVTDLDSTAAIKSSEAGWARVLRRGAGGRGSGREER